MIQMRYLYEAIPRLAREGFPVRHMEPATVMDRWQRGIDLFRLSPRVSYVRRSSVRPRVFHTSLA